MRHATVELQMMPGALSVHSPPGAALSITRPVPAGRLSYSGGELLLILMGGWYCHDLCRTAAAWNIALSSVDLHLEADWDGEVVRVRRVRLWVTLQAEASAARLHALIAATDHAVALPDALRVGAPITLGAITTRAA